MKNRLLPSCILLLIIFAACETKVDNGYSVSCRLEKDIVADSATMYIIETDYGRERKIETNRVVNGEVGFTGVVTEPKIAYIRFDDKSSPFYFIVENESVSIRIGNGYINMTGGTLNSDYFHMFAERRGLLNKRKSQRNKYVSMVKDSTMTAVYDQNFLKENTVLSDSLQRIYKKVLDRKDLISDIFLSEYGQEVNKSLIIQRK